MNLPAHVPVLVIGAGPTGLVTAHLLASYGVETLLVDALPLPQDIPRAVTIDDEALRALDACGQIEAVLPHLRPGKGARYFLEDQVPFAEVGPGPKEYGWPKRNCFHQPDLEHVLIDTLAEQPAVTFARGVRVAAIAQTTDLARVGLETPSGRHELTASVVIAADGARSTVRSSLGIAMDGDTYPQDWIVLDLARDVDDEPVSKFHCDPARPWVSIPTTFGGRRYEFMLLPGECGEDMLKLDVLRKLLAPIRPLPEEDIMRAAIYTFHARVAERFGEGRIWLLGDAAHLTPPFAGQGMNAGIRDAHNIAWKAAMVARQEAPAAILSSYEAERKEPARAMVQLAVAMGEIIMAVGEEQLKIRDALFAGLQRFPEARDWLLQMKFKPKPKYDQGLFLDLHSPEQPPASLVGAMLPNPMVIGSDSKQARLDRQLGNWFVEIGEGTTMPWPADGPDRGALRPLRAHRDQCVLVRPDRYVAAAGHDPEALQSEWEKLLQDWVAQ